MKLRTKITLVILEIGLIPILILGYVAYNNSYKRLEQALSNQLQSLATIQADRLTNVLNEQKEHIQTFVVNQVLVYELKGQIAKPSAKGQKSLNDSLQFSKNAAEEIKQISLIDTKGIIIASTEKDLIGRNVSNEEYFKRGLIETEVSILSKGSSETSPNQYLSAPMKLDNETVGVAVIVTDANDITNIVGNFAGLGKTGETLIAKSDEQGNSIFLAPTRFDPNAALNIKLEKSKYPNAPTVIILDNKNIQDIYFDRYTDYRGKKVIAAGKYIPNYDWAVVVKIDEAEFSESFINTRQVTFFIVAGALIAIFLIGISISRVVSDRIMELQKEVLAEQAKTEAKLFSKWLNMNEAMLDSIGDAVVVVDKNAKIIYANRSFQHLLNKDEEDVLSKNLFEVVPHVDEKGRVSKIAKRNLDKMLSAKKLTTTTTTTTTCIGKEDGSCFPVALITSPLVLHGKIIGAVESFRDITKEKEIDKAKTEFMSLAAHQLRTPLTSINWYIEILQEDKSSKIFTDTQKSYLSEVRRSSTRMVELIDALLHVSRLELGTEIINLQKIDLVNMVQNMLKTLAPEIKAKRLILNEVYGKSMPHFVADPDITNIIFQNLLSNSVKYTQGKGEISISIKVKEKGDKILNKKVIHRSFLIAIKDSGLGIPSSQQDKIFSKMFRADNAKRYDQNGNGLGLYLVKKVVDMYKGDIWFESAENKGTVFYIILPVKQSLKSTVKKA